MTTDSPHPLDVAMSDLPAHLHDCFAADVRSLVQVSGSLPALARESALEARRRFGSVESADGLALASAWAMLHDGLAHRLIERMNDNVTHRP